MSSTGTRPIIKLLALIVDRDKTKRAGEVFRMHHVHVAMSMMAQGTANSEIMDMLGLGSVDKSMIICLEPGGKAKVLMEELYEKLKLGKAGNGIAFTMPLSGVCSPLLHFADDETRNRIQNEVEKQVENISREISHSLVVTIANEGYTDDVMEAARGAGANGGTVLFARRIGVEEAVKFFGIELQTEKEVIVMLVSKEKKRDIMMAVNQACGMRTPARGMIFSLPVDSLIGVSQNDD